MLQHELPPASPSPNVIRWLGGVLIVLGFASITAFVLLVLLRGGRADAPPPATPTPEPAAVLAVDAALRSAPAGDTAIVQRLTAGTRLRPIGRTEAGGWLLVELLDSPGTQGWLRTGDLENAPPPESIAVVATSTSTPTSTATSESTAVATETATGTPAPELPDLLVESLFSRENRLVVAIANVGTVDATGNLFVQIEGGPPTPVDIKPGEPLRPGAAIEMVLPEQYVQRRANVLATVSTSPRIEEVDAENNSLEAVVQPDLPNDIAILNATTSGPDDRLVVVLRNGSPIPIRGEITLTVRAAPPQTQLLGRRTVALVMESQGSTEVDFPNITEPPLSQIEIRLFTEAIDDSQPANNVFPR